MNSVSSDTTVTATATATTTATLRKCTNIRSKRHPDQRCQRTAVQGDFCSLHYKKPTRFVPRTPPFPSPPTISSYLHATIACFQKKIRSFLGLKRYIHQGPATNAPELAHNDTELASLDPTESIPVLYRISFADSSKQIWLFDIRSLFEEMKRSSPLKNPYTSVPLSTSHLLLIQHRIAWLTKRKYSLQHIKDGDESPPTYQQKAVQLCLFIDTHGYLTNTDWFLSLVPSQIQLFLTNLEFLWNFRLGLTEEQKIDILPTWQQGANLTPNIRSRNSAIALDHLLTFLLDFAQASKKKDFETLVCMYILTALTAVSSSCKRAYPWLAQV